MRLSRFDQKLQEAEQALAVVFPGLRNSDDSSKPDDLLTAPA
jgi:hypothetical protein